MRHGLTQLRSAVLRTSIKILADRHNMKQPFIYIKVYVAGAIFTAEFIGREYDRYITKGEQIWRNGSL